MYSLRSRTTVRKFTPQRHQQGVRAGIKAFLEHLREQVAIDPPYRYVKQPPITAKQRRYLHWAFRTGILTMPYQRTGRVGLAWKVSLAGGGALKGTLTNATLAAYYLHDNMGRTRAHEQRGRLNQTELVQEEGPTAMGHFRTAYAEKVG